MTADQVAQLARVLAVAGLLVVVGWIIGDATTRQGRWTRRPVGVVVLLVGWAALLWAAVVLG